MRSPLAPALALTLAAAGAASAWRVDVVGSPSPSRPVDVTTSATGTVVAAGRIRGDGVQDDAAVVALDGATGAELWRHVLAGDDTTANDVYRRVVPGPAGTVVAGGRVFNLATGADAVVTRLASATGTVLWSSVRDGGEGLTDDVQDVAVLAGGDVVAVGRVEAGTGVGSFAVWRLDGSTGAVLWTTALDAPGGLGRRIVLSGDAAYVVGETDATGTDDDVLIARVPVAGGAPVWTTTVAGTAGLDDDAVGIAFAAGQVTVLANVVDTDSGPDGLVVALSAGSGTERWRQIVDGEATGPDDDDEFSALALAPNGDPIVAGSVANPATGDDLAVARLAAADGAVLWRTEEDGGDRANDEARGLVVATLGTADGAFVTGRLREPGVAGEIAGLRVDADTGAVVWRRAIEGGADRNDIGLTIAVDAAGDVVIGGRARQDATGDEFAVLKLSGASGGSFPCGNGVDDPGEACDDANAVRGDGCRPDCTLEVCGDGLLDPGEDCDDAANVCCTAGCAHAALGAPCDDEDACTQVDVCTAGSCVGTLPVQCPAPGQCETGGCDPATGLCAIAPRPDATTCDDGDACTRTDQCRTGVCVSGVAEICDDFDACTLDGCEAAIGCTFTELSGFPGIACAIDQDRIDRQCGVLVPRGIQRRIDKALRALQRGETATSPRRIRRLLRKVVRLARQAARKTERQRDRSRLPLVCAETLLDVLGELEARAAQPPFPLSV